MFIWIATFQSLILDYKELKEGFANSIRPFLPVNSFHFFWFFSSTISMIKYVITFSSESGGEMAVYAYLRVSTDQQDVDN
jgi:hypothetical protein